jgi:uncharacterized membrane protein HdeD (DUF308 family)
MFEVFPLVAGVVIALLVPRYVPSRRRQFTIGGAIGVLAGVLATLFAGEEWFFVFIDIAEVFIAMGVTLALVAYWPSRKTTTIR